MRELRAATLALAALLCLLCSAKALEGQQYIAPPDDLASLVRTVDAVVVASGGDPNSYSIVHPQVSPPVAQTVTEYRLKILEILKQGTEKSIEPALGPLEILMDEGLPVTLGVGRAAHRGLGKDKRYVLFLRWDPAIHKYWIAYGPYGVFFEEAGMLLPGRESSLSRKHQGASWPAFLADVRRAVKDGR